MRERKREREREKRREGVKALKCSEAKKCAVCENVFNRHCKLCFFVISVLKFLIMFVNGYSLRYTVVKKGSYRWP